MTTDELQALIDKWVEMYIKQTVDFRSGQRALPERFNELFNLSIKQGDDTAYTLSLVRDYLRQYKIERNQADADIIAHVDSVLAQVNGSVAELTAQFNNLNTQFTQFKTATNADIAAFKVAVNDTLAAADAANKLLINTFKTETNAALADNKVEMQQIVNDFVASTNASMAALSVAIHADMTALDTELRAAMDTVKVKSYQNRADSIMAVNALTVTVNNYKQETIDASINAVEGIVEDLVTTEIATAIQNVPGIGDTSTLNANTGHDNLTDSVIAAFQSASSGKTSIKTAITGVDPTVVIPTDATFPQLATAISQIKTGIDTSDATATAAQILNNITAYVNGVKITGTMPDRTNSTYNGGTVTVDTTNSLISIPIAYRGFYDTNSKIKITEPNLKTANIKAGTTILGVAGSDNVVDTSDANANAFFMLEGCVAYSKGVKITGTVPLVISGFTDTPYISRTGTTLRLATPTTSAYNGDAAGMSGLSATDANFTADNIMTGKSIFGLSGTAKRSASGTVTSAASNKTFTLINNSTQNAYYVTVNSLTFIPRIILIITGTASNEYSTICTNVNTTYYNGYLAKVGNYNTTTTSVNSTVYKADVNPASISSIGFTIPVVAPSTSYSWYAFE